MRLKNSTILSLISSLLIFLFVYTASSKILDYSSFLSALSASPLIGNKAKLLTIGLPPVEIGVAVLLLLPKTRLIGFYGSTILLILFTVYIAYMLLFVPHLPCSCGGVLKNFSWTSHLLFNIVFVGLSIIGVLKLKKHPLLYYFKSNLYS